MLRTGFVVSAVSMVLAATALVAHQVPAASGERAPVTFSKDIAPIVYAACASCHRPTGSAPFSLLSYADVRSRAKQIATVAARRTMPPWKPEPGYGEFVGERRLTDQQIATFKQWVDDGASEGDPRHLPSMPTWTGKWQLGEPDLVLQTEPYTLRATGDDMYRNFVLQIPTGETRYIKAWEFLPGNTHVVHHATMQFDARGTSRELDAKDPEPGYEGLIAHGVQSPEGYFLDWGPGHMPYVAPDGMAWPLKPRTDLVMMMHLRPSGRPETLQGTLGLYFSERPPSETPTLVRLTRQHLDIPPGDAHYAVTDAFSLDVDVDVYTVQPHAHNLAKEVKAFATRPDGGTTPLIHIRDWDFDWQGVYRYVRPVRLPAGSIIRMEYVYDNSAANKNNPHRPPRRATYGQRTTDEMAELWLQVVTRSAADRAKLSAAVQSKMIREEIIGHEKMLEADPSNVALHDGVALLHAEIGNLPGAAAHFAETLRVTPGIPAAHYNVGMALFMLGKRDEAGERFARAIELKPDYALAHDALGRVRQGQGDLAEAVTHFRRAVEHAPASADAHHHLATALRHQGLLMESIAYFQKALQLDPSRTAVRAELEQVQRELASPAQ